MAPLAALEIANWPPDLEVTVTVKVLGPTLLKVGCVVPSGTC